MTAISHKAERVALFAGSFDPFTIGHKSLVDRALSLFDRIVIAIGYNEHKSSSADIDERLQRIKEVYADTASVEVCAYTGLTVDYAKRVGAQFLLRGVRSVTDFEYERTLADVNRKISGIETVLIFSLPEHSYISSSMVRELQHNGVDASEFLP